jgi:multiple antibiotic resistance protein
VQYFSFCPLHATVRGNHYVGGCDMDIEFVKTAFITMLVAIDPIGLAAIFLSLTSHMTSVDRSYTARRAVIIAFCILTASALGGGALLRSIGIGMPAFSIAGGILLFFIAIEMVFERREQRKSHNATPEISYEPAHKIAACPLAIPLMAGPGAITATILQTTAAGGNWVNHAALIVILAVVLAACWLVFRTAGTIERLMGDTGRMVLSRMLGVLLAALAIQVIGDGVSAFVQSKM